MRSRPCPCALGSVVDGDREEFGGFGFLLLLFICFSLTESKNKHLSNINKKIVHW